MTSIASTPASSTTCAHHPPSQAARIRAFLLLRRRGQRRRRVDGVGGGGARAPRFLAAGPPGHCGCLHIPCIYIYAKPFTLSTPPPPPPPPPLSVAGDPVFVTVGSDITFGSTHVATLELQPSAWDAALASPPSLALRIFLVTGANECASAAHIVRCDGAFICPL